jgi:hypothetical protein
VPRRQHILEQLYPSIDYRLSQSAADVGTVVKSNGKFNDYEVFLPEDLGQLKALPPKRKAASPFRERAQTMSRDH